MIKNKKYAIIFLVSFILSACFSLYMILSALLPENAPYKENTNITEKIENLEEKPEVKEKEKENPEDYMNLDNGASKDEYYWAQSGVYKKIPYGSGPDKNAQRILFQYILDDTEIYTPKALEYFRFREEQVDAYFADLDDDGVDEVIGNVDNGFFRWNWGVYLYILKKGKDGKYKRIDCINPSGLDIEILNHKTNGFHDLKMNIAASRMIPKTIGAQYENNIYKWSYPINYIYPKDKRYLNSVWNFKIKRKDYNVKKEGIYKLIDFKKPADPLASDILYGFYMYEYGCYGKIKKGDAKGYFVDLNEDGTNDIIGITYETEKDGTKTDSVHFIIRKADGWEAANLWRYEGVDYIEVLNDKKEGHHSLKLYPYNEKEDKILEMVYGQYE